MIDWRSRNEGRLAVGVVVFAVVLLSAALAWGGGLNASFQNSRFDCPNDPSVVFCSKGDVTGANVLIGHSGANNMTYTEAFDNAAWTKTNVTVTADQVRGPGSWTNNADLLTPTAADSHVYQDDAGAAAGETHTCAFDLRSVTGNVDLSIHVYSETHTAIRGTEVITVTPYWRRYSVQGVLIAGDTDIGCTIGGNATWSTGENIYAVGAGSQENDRWRSGMGVYYPVLAAVTKPVLDLAHVNSPSSARAHVQIKGNKGPAREYDGVDQLYSVAHDASMNVFDGDMTLTMFLERDSDDAGEAIAFCHGSTNNDGFYLQASVPLGQWIAQFCQNADCTGPTATVATNDGRYHVVQVVREDDIATITVDGVESAGVDVTGYGIDANRALNVGAIDGPALWWDGQISYTVLRSRALSTDERAEEREMLLSIATNWSATNAWDFSRSTTAYKTFSNAYENTYPSHSMDLVAVDAPRVAGRGGGLLIEGDVTQLHGLTEAFDSWFESGTCAVTANGHVAPNGTLTADELDNTGGVNTHRRSVLTANLGDLTGRTFTGSVYVRADIPHTITIYMFELPAVGLLGGTTNFYVTNEWRRVDIFGVAAGGGNGTINFQIVPGENGVATGVAHFWGANLTETTFPTSYIPNAGAAASQVTKTADDISIVVLEAGTNNRILADEYCQGCAADKITLYGEWKAEWSSSTDIGADRRLVNMGNGSSANNDLELYVSSGGNVYLRFQDDGGTVYTINSAADPVDFSAWFSVRGVVDFTDLSRSELYINGAVDHAADTGNWTGGATYDTSGNEIRIGATRAGVVDGFHWTRRLRETNSEIRP